MAAFLRGLTGLRAMVASAFLFAVMAALVKAAAWGVPTTQVVVVRNVVHAALFVPLWWFATDRRLGNVTLLVVRAVVGLAALEAYAWTLGAMKLADAWILQAMNPVFVALLAPRLLGESSPRHVWAALALGLLGALLVVRPGFDVGWWPGVVGVAGGLAAAFAYMTVRLLGRTEHPLAVVMAFPVVEGPLSVPFALPVWTTPTGLEWLAMVGAALAAAGGQLLMTIGLRGARAAPATTATYAGFVFAAFLGWAAFGETPPATTWLGTVAIFLAVALLGRRAVTARPTGGPVVPPAGDPVP